MLLDLLEKLPKDQAFPKIAECSICGQPFSRKRDLRRHLLAAHFSSDLFGDREDMAGDEEEVANEERSELDGESDHGAA